MAGSPRPAWKVVHVLPSDDGRSDHVAAARRWLEAGVDRLLVDTAGGPHQGGTGMRADRDTAAAIAREVPVTLAGGLTAANVAAALREIPAVGVDVASGVEAPRVPGERPTKDPFLVGLFVKRAKAARDDRPNVPFGPTPVHAGLLDADGAGRWGMERDFGGRYVPETLMAALAQLESAYDALRQDPVFWSELRVLLERFAGRPTALYRADRLAAAVRGEAVRLAGGALSTRRPAADRALSQAGGPRPHGRAQDQQRAGTGAPHPPPRQDPGDRRDRRRPARRRDRDRVRLARPAVRRLHGRRGHRTPGAERAPDAGARCRGAQRHEWHGHAEGRGQRGDARLGDERRDDPLRPGVGDGSAPVPDDRARPPAPDRRRGSRPAQRRRGSPARSCPGLRGWRLQRDRAARAVHRRAVGPAGGGGGGRRRARRRAGMPPRSWAARRASSTARAR